MYRIFLSLILVLSLVSVVHSAVSKMLEPDHHLLQFETMNASMFYISPYKPSNIQKRTTTAGQPAKVTKAGLEITPEIRELARGLRNDPQLIYEFVRNNIDYSPTFGLTKGATMTYLDGEGNDMDQTTLLIALMRAAGYTANYMYGDIRLTGEQVMSWLGIPDDPNLAFIVFYYGGKDTINVFSSGGSIDYVQIEHAWAKVSIDGTDYMFDPSFKEYTYKPGVDLVTALGYDKSTFIARAANGMTSSSNYLENMNRANIRSDLTTYTSNLVNYIETNIPGAGIDDVIGGRRIKVVRNQPFQTTLDHVTGVWEWMPDETMVYFSYYNNLYPAEGNFDVNLEAREIYGKRLTLHTTFDGTDYYVHLILEGEEIGVGKYTEDNQFSIWLDHASLTDEGTYGDQYERINLDRDAFYCFVNGWGHTDRKIIEKRRMTLEQFLADGLALDSEAVLGESLNLIGLSWLSETSSVNKISDSVSNAITIRHHDFGWLMQKDTIIIDTPMSASSPLPLDGSTWPPPGGFFAKSGLKSAFEWGAIDQMQPISAVSTIKLLDIANMQGDKIFDATSSNYDSDVRPNLVNYTAEQLNTLDDYISQYYRLILPEHGDLQDKNFRGPGFYALYYDESIKTLIMGGLNGGYGNEYGECDPDSAANEQKNRDNPEDHPKSAEPIDLLTGHYLETSMDLSTGGGQLPFGLDFIRTYNSGSRLQDGLLGLGRDHNWNVKARKGSNGFVGLGGRSVVDAAPAIAEIYIAADILQDGLGLDRLMISTLAHRWLVDNLIDNVVNISANRVTYQFVKLPDGTYNPPPGQFAQLNLEADDSFLLVEKHGEQLDFDTEGRLASQQDLNGNLVTLNYIGDKLSTITNNMGRTLTISYDVNNRLSAVSDGTGRSVSYIYDSAGNLITAIDPELNQTKYGYDIDGRLTRIFMPSDPVNPSVINSYDFLDRVATQLDSAGNPYTYYYAGTRTEEVDPLGNSRILYFDKQGRNTVSIDPIGNETTYFFDGQDRLIKRVLPEGNGNEFDYDIHHNLIRKTTFPKPGSGESPVVDQFVFDLSLNRSTSSIDSLGNTTSYSYDTQGNRTRIEGTQINGETPFVDFAFNSLGQVATITDSNGTIKSHSYDSATGDLLLTTLDQGGLNLTIQYEYDAIGNLTGLTDARGNKWTFEYDANRRLIKKITPSPFYYETQYIYDVNGHRIETMKQENEAGTSWQTTSLTHTLAGDVATFTDPEGFITSFQYDTCGRLWKVTDAANQVIEFIYDALGRPYRQIDALGNIVEEHTYTANGREASVKDANNNMTTYTYGSFDGLSRIIYADGTFVEVDYDELGRPIWERMRSGNEITYSYDALGRLISKVFPGSLTVQFTYDLIGRLVNITDNSGAIVQEFDAIGRRTRVTYPDGKTVGNEYDAAGNRIKLIYPDGIFVSYIYDELNRLSEIRDAVGSSLTSYSYDPLYRLQGQSNMNGTNAAFSYEIDNQINSLSHHFSGGSSVNFNYTYNAINNLVEKTSSDSAFTYFLTASSSTTFVANNLNQIASANGTAFSYDSNGNLSWDGINQYNYDAQNKLVQANTPLHTVSYDYDGFGRRTAKVVDGQMTKYFYDGSQVIMEYGSGDTVLRRYLYSPVSSHPVRMETSNEDYYYHTDHLGSVVALTNSSGVLVESNAYRPFGKPQNSSSVENPFLFTGKTYDEETGLYYFHKRYYSPSHGKFLSTDPQGTSGGDLNLYTYCLNSPVMYVDPDGEFPVVAVIAAIPLVVVGVGGYATDYIELPWDPYGQEAASVGSFILTGPSWKKEHPVVRESMLVHERTHKGNFHAYQIWKTPVFL